MARKKKQPQFVYADQHPAYSKIIRFSPDYREDRYLLTSICEKLYKEGKLDILDIDYSVNKRVYAPHCEHSVREFGCCKYWNHPDMVIANKLIEVSR